MQDSAYHRMDRQDCKDWWLVNSSGSCPLCMCASARKAHEKGANIKTSGQYVSEAYDGAGTSEGVCERTDCMLCFSIGLCAGTWENTQLYFHVNTPETAPLTQADILTHAATRKLLEQLGHSPRHPLGQNFLIDPNIVLKSLALGGVVAGDHVVEIGPGLGTLTIALLAAGAHVWAVEFDATLFEALQTQLLPRAQGRLHLIKGDAVDFPLAGLPASEQADKPFKIIANLPYAIATPWMDKVLSQPRLPDQMVLMLQRENADRFTAPEGPKQRGAISIYLEAAYERQPGYAVSRQCFLPPPNVDSVLLNLKRRQQCPPFSPRTKAIIRQFFTQRRKQIGALCRKHPETGMLAQWLAQTQIDPRRRPETLTLAEWKALDTLARAQAE